MFLIHGKEKERTAFKLFVSESKEKTFFSSKIESSAKVKALALHEIDSHSISKTMNDSPNIARTDSWAQRQK